MRVDSKFSTGKGQRQVGAAPVCQWEKEAVEWGEKGLQDKGSASWALLSVCLHIFFLRDTVSLEGAWLKRIGSNPPFIRPNREQCPRSPSYLRAAATRPLVGSLRP